MKAQEPTAPKKNCRRSAKINICTTNKVWSLMEG